MEFEIIWIISSVFFLGWAAIQDWKKRLIEDRIWLIQLGFSLIIYIWWFKVSATSSEMIISLINILMSMIFSFFLFYSGAFSGADSKALFVLSINSPIAYSISIITNDLSVPYFSIMGILFNMFIFFILFAFLLLILNIYQITSMGPLFKGTHGTKTQKFMVLISARRVWKGQVEQIKFHDPVEVLEANHWKLYTPVFQGPMDDETFERLEREMREAAVRDVIESNKPFLWMRPQPPGIIFILLAQITWIFIGSPFTILLKYYIG